MRVVVGLSEPGSLYCTLSYGFLWLVSPAMNLTMFSQPRPACPRRHCAAIGRGRDGNCHIYLGSGGTAMPHWRREWRPTPQAHHNGLTLPFPKSLKSPDSPNIECTVLPAAGLTAITESLAVRPPHVV